MLPFCMWAWGVAGPPAATGCGGDLPALVPFMVCEAGRRGRWVLACMLMSPAAEPCTSPAQSCTTYTLIFSELAWTLSTVVTNWRRTR